MSIRFLDFYPVCGTFLPDEMIRLVAEVNVDGSYEVMINLQCFHFQERNVSFNSRLNLKEGLSRIPLEFEVHSEIPGGYGVKAELLDLGGRSISVAETAFDVLHSWIDYPRYGFLTDFRIDRLDLDDAINDLARFHINGLQFYDWHYRHDQLLSPNEHYLDPLGRKLSLDTVRGFIHAAHEHGIGAMAYLAIYAASMEFWGLHPDWRLLDAEGNAILFEDFLGIMDPSPGSAWTEHLLGECEKVLTALLFDGLHIDQYGDPKVGLNMDGERVDIPLAFKSFITASRERFPTSVLTFNAVGNWPIDALACTSLDFNYIEIWPDTPGFQDLRRIIFQARAKSANKSLVIALYLPADHIPTIRLVDAIIFASGACRIELGEGMRLLADPYFPNHQPMPPELIRILRRYYDFAVRYAEWIGPSALDAHDIVADLPEGVWCVIRETKGWLVIHLINMTGLEKACWNKKVPPPETRIDFSIAVTGLKIIQGAWWASPDSGDLDLKPAAWRLDGKKVILEVRQLEYWTMVSIEIE
jgi:dextranase